MEFLYKLDYEDHRSSVHPDRTPGYDPTSLLVNAKLYIIAEKYEIQALKELACTKYQQVLPETWNTSVFAESARLVYDNTVETDRMLRDIIVEVASNNAKTLLDRGEFVDLLKSNGGLATEIMRKAIDRYESLMEPQQTNIPDRKSVSGLQKVEEEWNGRLPSSKKPKKTKHVI